MNSPTKQGWRQHLSLHGPSHYGLWEKIKALAEVGLEAQLTGAGLFSCCALIAFDCMPMTWADSRKEAHSAHGIFLVWSIRALGWSLAWLQQSGWQGNSRECDGGFKGSWHFPGLWDRTGQDILFFWLLLVWSCNLELVPTSKALQLLADSTPGWGLGSYRGCLK